jgi:dolichol-phosphate mannosyltransferase
MTAQRRLGQITTAARVVAIGAVAVRLVRAAKPRPSIEPAVDDPKAPAITVIIPARNEQARIAACLQAMVGAPGVTEVIVVDDDSTDDTAAFATSLGARVVSAGTLPEGWAGKTWALQCGIEAATTAWVVTLDADTDPDPRLPAALVARCRADGWHLLTVAGRFRCPTPALAALHPSLLTTLVYRYGPPGAKGQPRTELTMANGQCAAFRRQHLLDARALHHVKDSLIEDVALARYTAGLGWNVGFLDASDLLTVNMHDSAADAWKGWGRSLPLGGVASEREQAEGLGVVWLAQALPIMRLVARRADKLDALALMLRIGTLFGTRRAYNDPPKTYWLSPFADPLVAARLTQSTLRPERTWRGRQYPKPPPKLVERP